MRIVVLADTHVRPGSSRRLPDAARAQLAEADHILHAGDVVAPELLDELADLAPVTAVLGNNDHGLARRLPERVELELDGVRIAMVHDSGPRKGREARLRRWFPEADLVVFGHSHIPWDGPGVGGQWLLNPGSPTERRGRPHHTVAVVDTMAGRFTTGIVAVGPGGT